MSHKWALIDITDKLLLSVFQLLYDFVLKKNKNMNYKMYLSELKSEAKTRVPADLWRN